MLGLIGGSGFERLAQDGAGVTSRAVHTPYGSVTLEEVHVGRESFVFWSRHGTGHERPPHRILARAGLWALRSAGVTRILATQAVGTLHPSRFPVGSLALIGDLMDFTRSGSRERTFFDGPPLPVVHMDATHLYCEDWTAGVCDLADPKNQPADGVILAVTEGPRLETPAEIRALSRLGADVVGMTAVPEAVLAKELGMCYCGLAILTNAAAGLSDRVDGQAIEETAVRARDQVLNWVRNLMDHPDLCDAPCGTCHPWGASDPVSQVLSQPALQDAPR